MTRRATRDGEPARNLTIRAYDEERAAWEQLATESGTSLSAWISKTLNAEVERARRAGRRSKP